MGKVTYQFPVADICGKIGKDAEVGFAHRGNTKYTVKYGKRTTEPSAEELAHREKFKTVLAATRLRLKDPDQSLQDQLAFAKQTKYKSLYRYVFNLEWAKA